MLLFICLSPSLQNLLLPLQHEEARNLFPPNAGRLQGAGAGDVLGSSLRHQGLTGWLHKGKFPRPLMKRRSSHKERGMKISKRTEQITLALNCRTLATSLAKSRPHRGLGDNRLRAVQTRQPTSTNERHDARDAKGARAPGADLSTHGSPITAGMQRVLPTRGSKCHRLLLSGVI